MIANRMALSPDVLGAYRKLYAIADNGGHAISGIALVEKTGSDRRLVIAAAETDGAPIDNEANPDRQQKLRCARYDENRERVELVWRDIRLKGGADDDLNEDHQACDDRGYSQHRIEHAERPDLTGGKKQERHLNDKVQKSEPNRNGPSHAAGFSRLISRKLPDENRPSNGRDQCEQNAEPLFWVRVLAPPFIYICHDRPFLHLIS
jgi:hypothetical protein